MILNRIKFFVVPEFLSRLFRRLMKSWGWVLLVLLTIAIKWVSLYPEWVEKNYTYGLYPLIAKVQRFLFGWLPFSLGDLLYVVLVAALLYRIVLFFKRLFRKKVDRKYLVNTLQKAIFLFLFIYVVFNLLWGLNYNRKGVAGQFDLEVKAYSKSDLDTLCRTLQAQLNFYAGKVDTLQREAYYGKTKNLFKEAKATYELAEKRFGFLAYKPASIKSSLVGFLGKYVGFQGYYNPLTGEGQIKRSIPTFLQPFVVCHEIAHQLGYAKENEANFAGFLAARESASHDFRYSAYYDMYSYAMREMYSQDIELARNIDSTMHPVAKRDRREYMQYLYKMQNRVAPFMLKMYDGYLRMNNQPKGYRTYDEVVTWLIAYYKKYGLASL